MGMLVEYAISEVARHNYLEIVEENRDYVKFFDIETEKEVFFDKNDNILKDLVQYLVIREYERGLWAGEHKVKRELRNLLGVN